MARFGSEFCVYAARDRLKAELRTLLANNWISADGTNGSQRRMLSSMPSVSSVVSPRRHAGNFDEVSANLRPANPVDSTGTRVFKKLHETDPLPVPDHGTPCGDFTGKRLVCPAPAQRAGRTWRPGWRRSGRSRWWSSGSWWSRRADSDYSDPDCSDSGTPAPASGGRRLVAGCTGSAEAEATRLLRGRRGWRPRAWHARGDSRISGRPRTRNHGKP